MLSPEPPELPREFSNMKYPLLNRTILSMSSDINDEDEDSIEDEEDFVFCSSERGDYIEDSFKVWDENVSSDEINKIKKEETSGIDDHDHERVKHLDSKGLKNEFFQIVKYKLFRYIGNTIFRRHTSIFYLCNR